MALWQISFQLAVQLNLRGASTPKYSVSKVAIISIAGEDKDVKMKRETEKIPKCIVCGRILNAFLISGQKPKNSDLNFWRTQFELIYGEPFLCSPSNVLFCLSASLLLTLARMINWFWSSMCSTARSSPVFFCVHFAFLQPKKRNEKCQK